MQPLQVRQWLHFRSVELEVTYTLDINNVPQVPSIIISISNMTKVHNMTNHTIAPHYSQYINNYLRDTAISI